LQRIPSVTARIETSFHKPVPIETRLNIRACVTGQHRKLSDARAEVKVDNASGPLVAESNAGLYAVPAPEIRKQQKPVEAP
jgi:acyl-coenzyme A thioesterase PaaI-like protein